jgi:hypothetical protein
MTTQEWDHLTSRLAYKQDTNIKVLRQSSMGFYDIVVSRMVVDVTDLSRSIMIGSTSSVPEEASEEQVIQVIKGCLERFEVHECREWFTLDGVQVTNPHKQETIFK